MIEKITNQNQIARHKLAEKINEIIDAVNELQNRIDPPSVYQVMKDKDAIIGKHIGEKQRLQDELDRTRKALDILLFTINRLENQNYKDCAWHLRLAIAKIEATGIADKAVEQITALEQKDK